MENFMEKNKKLKQPLHLKGYQVNPQGHRTPVFSTVAPRQSSLSGARKKLN